MYNRPYTTIDQARIMPFTEALAQYDMPERSDFMLTNIEGNFYIFEEDAYFKSMDLDALFYTDNLCGAYFKGNLTVDTCLIQPEIDYGPFVYVRGNVTAKNIYLGGGYIHFHGDVNVEQTIVAGTYNHGMSAINGYISAEVIISNDHIFDYKSNHIKKGILFINNQSENNPPYDPVDVFNKRFWDKNEECINTRHILKATKEGTSILKADSGASPVIKRLEKASTSKAKRADLSKLKLKSLPPELLQMKELEQVNLSQNPITDFSEELASMTQLNTLDLSHCELTVIPEVLTRLTSLEALDLSNNSISLVPDSFAALTQLKKLSIDRCNLPAIPEVLKQLPKLEVLDIEAQADDVLLSIDGGFDALKELHIWGDLNAPLPKLERLYLRRRSLLQIPDVLRASKKLKVLKIHDSIQLEALPDWLTELAQLEELSLFLNRKLNLEILAQLPKLKTLHIDYDNYGFPKRQIEQLLEVPSWTSLRIKEIEDVTVLKRIVDRPNLKKLVIKHVFHEDEIDIQEARQQLALTIG